MCMQVVIVPVTTNVGCSKISFSLCATAAWHNKETQKYFMIFCEVRTIFISRMDFNSFGRKVLLLYLLCTQKFRMLPDWDRNPEYLMRMCYRRLKKKKSKRGCTGLFCHLSPSCLVFQSTRELFFKLFKKSFLF